MPSHPRASASNEAGMRQPAAAAPSADPPTLSLAFTPTPTLEAAPESSAAPACAGVGAAVSAATDAAICTLGPLSPPSPELVPSGLELPPWPSPTIVPLSAPAPEPGSLSLESGPPPVFGLPPPALVPAACPQTPPAATRALWAVRRAPPVARAGAKRGRSSHECPSPREPDASTGPAHPHAELLRLRRENQALAARVADLESAVNVIWHRTRLFEVPGMGRPEFDLPLFDDARTAAWVAGFLREEALAVAARPRPSDELPARSEHRELSRLERLRKHGCAPDERLLLEATVRRKQGVMRWAMAHGADPEKAFAHPQYGNISALAWVADNRGYCDRREVAARFLGAEAHKQAFQQLREFEELAGVLAARGRAPPPSE